MEISSAHQQTMANHEMEEMLGVYPKDHQQEQQRQDERKLKPPTDQILRCPRCDSTNTKFCYYNNYSLTQPRYFCKGCRRYWTQGGTLRNVPVGGGCRKNKRSSSSSSKIKGTPTPRDQFITTNNSNSHFPNLPSQVSYDPNDLTLAFSGMQNHDHFFPPNPNPNPNHGSAYVPNNTGLLDILRGGFLDNTGRTNAPTNGFGFHNLYYGYGGNANTEVESSTVSEEIMVPFEGSTTSQIGTCKGVDGGENKLVMGLPWQLNAGDGEYWNGAAATNWHGLINTSLM